MAATEKSAEQLQQEIDELYRRKREITERLRDPRGLRRGMPYGRNAVMGGTRPLAVQRGVIRRLEEFPSEDQPPPKKRISSTVVKVNEEKVVEAGSEALNEVSLNVPVDTKDGDFPSPGVGKMDIEENEVDRRRAGSRVPFLARRDYRRGFKDPDQFVEPAPRVLTKEENPSLAKRNRRMFGALLGTLQKFVAEDSQLASSEAFTRRSDSLKRGQQTHEVGESSRPSQTDDDIFRTQLVTAVTMFAQVMQNPRFLAFLQPPLPSQQVGPLDHIQKPFKAQPQVIHSVESMETPVHLLETMQSPKPRPNAQEQVAEMPVFQTVPVQPATFQQPICNTAYATVCVGGCLLAKTELK
ncbi:hypothetical protein L7F22_003315 [Adiantum nelumboides]|nr:hypothetical protein [Adiantum nelumboides]